MPPYCAGVRLCHLLCGGLMSGEVVPPYCDVVRLYGESGEVSPQWQGSIKHVDPKHKITCTS